MSPWRPLLGLLPRYPGYLKSSHCKSFDDRAWNRRVPDLQMDYRGLTTWQDTRLVVPEIVARQATCSIIKTKSRFYPSLQMGYVSLSSGVFYPLTWTDLDLPALGEFGHVPEKYSFNFSAGEYRSETLVTCLSAKLTFEIVNLHVK